MQVEQHKMIIHYRQFIFITCKPSQCQMFIIYKFVELKKDVKDNKNLLKIALIKKYDVAGYIGASETGASMLHVLTLVYSKQPLLA